jgi:hypothetical protein
VGVVTTPDGESGVKTTPTAEASAGVEASYSVTVHAGNKAAALDAIKALAQLGASPTLGGSLTDNPIMDQINSKSMNLTGVSPATLQSLKQNVSSYSETLSGTGHAMAGFETSFGKDNDLTKLEGGVKDDTEVSLSRTVTINKTDKNGDPTDITLSRGFSVKSTVGADGSAGGLNFESPSVETTSTQTWNLNAGQQTSHGLVNLADPKGTVTSKDLEDPEGTLQSQNRTNLPDETELEIKTETTSGGTDALPFSNSYVYEHTHTSKTEFDRNDPNSSPKTSVSDTRSTTMESTISLGGEDSLISGKATLSQPIFV